MNPNKKAKEQEKEKEKRKRNRRRKRVSNVKGGADAEMDVEETTSSQTQENVPEETQHVDLQEDKELQTAGNGGEPCDKDAETPKRCEDKSTQTPVVRQSNQETQTDLPVTTHDDTKEETTPPGSNDGDESQREEHKHAPEPKQQDDRASSKSTNEQNPRKKSKTGEETPSAGTSVDPTDLQDETAAGSAQKTRSYAKVVSGDGESSRAADKTTKPSQSTR